MRRAVRAPHVVDPVLYLDDVDELACTAPADFFSAAFSSGVSVI